jgi:hypothetical protein
MPTQATKQPADRAPPDGLVTICISIRQYPGLSGSGPGNGICPDAIQQLSSGYFRSDTRNWSKKSSFFRFKSGSRPSKLSDFTFNSDFRSPSILFDIFKS